MSKRAVWASVDTNPGEFRWLPLVPLHANGGLAKAGTADPYDQDDRERNERRR